MKDNFMVLILKLITFLYVFNVSSALAQTYPDKPIKFIIPYAPGGATDLAARAIGKEMSLSLGQPIIIENRPGNVGAIAAAFTAKISPDGYTLCFCTDGPLTIIPTLQPSAITYKPLQDFTFIGLIDRVELGLFARQTLPISNLTDLVAVAKISPNNFTYATASVPGPNYLAFELFMQRAGIKMLNVPYKGDGPAVIALAGGEVDLFVGGLQSALPMLRTGRIKAIAMTGLVRSKLLPAVPTIDESGYPGYEHSAWAGLIGPAGLSSMIVNRLHRALEQAVQQASVIKVFEENALISAVGTPEDFRRVIEKDTLKFAEIIDHLRIKKN